MLPEIKSSAENFGLINSGCLKGVPITAVYSFIKILLLKKNAKYNLYNIFYLKVLGDQQADLVGQLCWDKGSAKNT